MQTHSVTPVMPDLSLALPTLRRAGYADLHPIIPPGARLTKNSRLEPELLGKVPGRYSGDGAGGWCSYKWAEGPPSHADLLYSLKHGGGLGTLTRNLPFIDCDVLDPELAGRVEQVVRDVLGARDSPKRIGRAPRWAMPFRCDGEPFKRLKLQLTRAGESVGILEVLGAGSQIVLAGQHPSGVLYSWVNGRAGGIEILAEKHAASLPAISPVIITETLLPALQAELAPHGVTLTIQGGSSATLGPVPDQASLLAPSVGEVRRLVEQLSNDADYHEYISVGRMTRAACGEENVTEGLEIWQEWCGRGAENHPELNEAKWTSFHSPHNIGWDALQSIARRHGINTGPLVFDADPDAMLPAAILQKMEPLPTEGERIAAILGDAMPSLYLEVATLRGAELLRRWKTLQAAARTADPLHNFFHSTVLPLADRYRGREHRCFAMLLRSALKQHAEWGPISAEEQDLLLSAGWAFAAPPSVLMGRGGGLVPEMDIFGPQPPRVWIVDGSIPAESVGVVFGPPKARKTFVVTDLAARIAAGLPVRNHTVQRGGVLYFASESIPQICERLRAWVLVNGDCNTNFRLIPKALPILDPAETLRQITHRVQFPSGDPIRLVVVDVLRSSISDENSNEVMAAATATAQLVAWAFGVAVILVHHAPRADAARTSGGNALEGGVDWGWGVIKKGATSSVTVRMSRGDDEGDEWHVRVEDGVLREVTDRRVAWADMFTEKEAALTAGRVGHRLGAGTTRGEIKDGIRSDHPAWFDKTIPLSTARNRVNNAISDAVKTGYLVAQGRGFAPGSITPPPAAPANLESII